MFYRAKRSGKPALLLPLPRASSDITLGVRNWSKKIPNIQQIYHGMGSVWTAIYLDHRLWYGSSPWKTTRPTALILAFFFFHKIVQFDPPPPIRVFVRDLFSDSALHRSRCGRLVRTGENRADQGRELHILFEGLQGLGNLEGKRMVEYRVGMEVFHGLGLAWGWDLDG